MKIPFVDLTAQYAQIKSAVDEAILKVVGESAFISGKYAGQFEAEFSRYLGVSDCVACANGTDALEIGLKAIGVGKDDEVLVPANTWISTSEAVSNIAARPVFVDILKDRYTLDPAEIERKLTRRTKAVIPVHLYGLPAEMDEILEQSKRFGLKVLEDCAQAHGASYKGRSIGTFGDAATFSFYPSKNLGAFGDAGAIVTNNPEVAQTARLIANHGQISKNRHVLEGRNSRLDGIQAAVLSAKLPYLESWTEARRKNAAIYDEVLSGSGIPLPFGPDYSRHVYHLYVVRIENRDDVQRRLSDDGIETGIHYPKALPFVEAYQGLGHAEDDFPVAATQMDQLLSLPMYAELTPEMIAKVAASLLQAVNR